MKNVVVFFKRVFTNPLSLILVATNLAADIWIYFFKPSVPGFRYDYYEEPTYFKIFQTINIIPETITGWIFYPIDHLFSLEQHIRWQSAIFYLIFALLSSVQWALIGYLLVYAWRSFRTKQGERRITKT
jgi:hypothetical protein